MNKKLLAGTGIAVLLIAIGLFFVLKGPSSIVLDNFEDANITEAPKWWSFDRVKLNVVKSTDQKCGKYRLMVDGVAQGWYAGGFGMTLAQPVDQHSHLQLDVYGTGPQSGKLKIELADDDNQNDKIEQNRFMNYMFMKDDKFVYELPITWQGWKTVAIPFASFKDDNPKIGSNQWDPNGEGGSGGLINISFIVIGASETGAATFGLDNLEILTPSSRE